MHFYKYPTDPAAGAASPAPTYRYSVMRSMGASVDWCYVETSDNVFDWSRLDSLVDFFAAAGKDFYYQIHYTPAFHATGLWALVPDKDRGKIGGMCPPVLSKLARFVDLVVKRYNTDLVRNNGGLKKIKFISPGNEWKFDEPVVEVHYTTAALVGSISIGNTVTGLTSGQTGTVLKVGVVDGTKSYLRIKLSNTVEGGAKPFVVGETVQKDGSNRVVCVVYKTLYYLSGTAAQAAEISRTVYQSAKAADPEITVTSPDFTEGFDGELNHIAAWCSASDSNGGTGKQWCDILAYHMYDYDGIQEVTRFSLAYPVVQRFFDLKNTLASVGVSKPIHITESGWNPGWWWNDVVTEPKNRIAVIKRTVATIAAMGGHGWYGFSHDTSPIGNPSTSAEISAALDDIGRVLQGADISSFKVKYGGYVKFVANGREYVW